jgi:hypothetical protein
VERDVVGRSWGPGGSQTARGGDRIVVFVLSETSINDATRRHSIPDWRVGEGWRRLVRGGG